MTLVDDVRALVADTDRAVVAMVVQRLPGEQRATPPSITLDPTCGVIGDRWGEAAAPNPEAMVTLMRWDVAALLAARAGVPVEILGDNLFASLDTGASNLPPGTVLQIGGARCVVTPKPHRGCNKFAARVGKDAWALTLSEEAAQLRGVHLRVLVPGEVAVGDIISVVSRPG